MRGAESALTACSLLGCRCDRRCSSGCSISGWLPVRAEELPPAGRAGRSCRSRGSRDSTCHLSSSNGCGGRCAVSRYGSTVMGGRSSSALSSWRSRAHGGGLCGLGAERGGGPGGRREGQRVGGGERGEQRILRLFLLLLAL